MQISLCCIWESSDSQFLKHHSPNVAGLGTQPPSVTHPAREDGWNPNPARKKEWETINTDLLLKIRRESAQKKMEMMVAIIYIYWTQRICAEDQNSRSTEGFIKSSRQQEIKRLMKERRSVWKQWKKAIKVEKKGFESLQGCRDRLQCCKGQTVWGNSARTEITYGTPSTKISSSLWKSPLMRRKQAPLKILYGNWWSTWRRPILTIKGTCKLPFQMTRQLSKH